MIWKFCSDAFSTSLSVWLLLAVLFSKICWLLSSGLSSDIKSDIAVLFILFSVKRNWNLDLPGFCPDFIDVCLCKKPPSPAVLAIFFKDAGSQPSVQSCAGNTCFFTSFWGSIIYLSFDFYSQSHNLLLFVANVLMHIETVWHYLTTNTSDIPSLFRAMYSKLKYIT